MIFQHSDDLQWICTASLVFVYYEVPDWIFRDKLPSLLRKRNTDKRYAGFFPGAMWYEN